MVQNEDIGIVALHRFGFDVERTSSGSQGEDSRGRRNCLLKTTYTVDPHAASVSVVRASVSRIRQTAPSRIIERN